MTFEKLLEGLVVLILVVVDTVITVVVGIEKFTDKVTPGAA
jgi:hypothetical protein